MRVKGGWGGAGKLPEGRSMSCSQHLALCLVHRRSFIFHSGRQDRQTVGSGRACPLWC